ncbi:hypothetical protein HON01_05485 [Candidatus Woesearchaeota archaeon]|nr:hypothetical protein [Candidatus Woesearchaeota archaeon]
MFIGRGLDALLFCARSKGLSAEIAHPLRDLVLSIKPMRYINSKGKLRIEEDSFRLNPYSYYDGVLKRGLAKAFDWKWMIPVGEKYSVQDALILPGGMGFRQKVHFDIIRLEKNVLQVTMKNNFSSNIGKYIVSSSKKKLLEFQNKRAKPIYYGGVIF